MERLTSYESDCKREMICRYEDCDTCEENCPHLNEDNCPCLQEILNKLAEYQDLEEQGKLLKLPCAVGDIIYEVSYENREFVIKEHIVKEFVYRKYRFPRIEIYCENENGFLVCNSMGKLDECLFLTKSAAEQALKEMEDRKNER